MESKKNTLNGINWKNNKLEIIGFTASFIWLALGTYALYTSTGCSNSEDKVIVIACLSANELGDFLAGVFAPLAFGWLAIAVLMQSRDFKLSVEVADAQKNAMVSQAKEAKTTACYIKEQTEIMKLERKQREQENANVEFRALASSLRKILEDVNGSQFKGFEDVDAIVHCINNLPTKDFPDSTEVNIRNIVNIIKDIRSKLRSSDSFDYERLRIPHLINILDGTQFD